MFKMPFKTKAFNENQKVFITNMSGACAAEVVGKYRGKHRYIKQWVSWDKKWKDAPDIKKIYINSDFAVNKELQVLN